MRPAAQYHGAHWRWHGSPVSCQHRHSLRGTRLSLRLRNAMHLSSTRFNRLEVGRTGARDGGENPTIIAVKQRGKMHHATECLSRVSAGERAGVKSSIFVGLRIRRVKTASRRRICVCALAGRCVSTVEGTHLSPYLQYFSRLSLFTRFTRHPKKNKGLYPRPLPALYPPFYPPFYPPSTAPSPSSWPRWPSPDRWCAPSSPPSADCERHRYARDRDRG